MVGLVRSLFVAAAWMAALLASACFIDSTGSLEASGGAPPTTGGAGGEATSSATTGGAAGSVPEGGGGGGGSTPTDCGNGVIDPGEACDGGGLCDEDCTVSDESPCAGAEALAPGLTTVQIDAGLPGAFGAFADFPGTGCEAAPSQDVATRVFEYAMPEPHDEGLFVSANPQANTDTLLFAYQGCGTEAVDCGRDGGLFGIHLPMSPAGTRYFLGVADANDTDAVVVDLYARPYRYFSDFGVAPADWNVPAPWSWEDGELKLTQPSTAALESSTVVVDGYADIWIGVSYRTGMGGSGTVLVSYDGGDFAVAGDLPSSGSTWVDLTSATGGAQDARVRIVADDDIWISAVMIGPVTPAI